MERVIMYTLPMYSSSLNKDPEIIYEDLDTIINLEGYKEGDELFKVSLFFETVLCSKHTSARFTPTSYNSYDTVVELINSDWLKELYKLNSEYFDFWKPKHYVIYLDDIGLYQFIAVKFNAIEK